MWDHNLRRIARRRFASCYGPRLASVVALCTGGYRMSKRKVASFCREVLGVELSVGEICQIEQTVRKAVAPAVEEAAVYVQSCDANIDETPWKERHQRRVVMGDGDDAAQCIYDCDRARDGSAARIGRRKVWRHHHE